MQDRFDVGGFKKRNIAIQLVFQQCCKTSCMFFCCPFFHSFSSTESKREAFDNDLVDKVSLSQKKEFLVRISFKKRKSGRFLFPTIFLIMADWKPSWEIITLSSDKLNWVRRSNINK